MVKNNKAKRGIAALLTLAMTASLCCTLAPTAEAKTSLPAIEDVKTSAADGETFKILEIVPDATQGSIGYYIDGKEPWLSYVGAKTKPSERTSYVNSTLRNRLNRDGGSGDGNAYTIALCNPTSLPSGATKDDYPLNYSTNNSENTYSEAYPWQANSYTRMLPLAKAESATVKGSMSSKTGGDYSVGPDSNKKSGGDLLQNVSRLYSAPISGEEGWWYDVRFTELQYTEETEPEYDENGDLIEQEPVDNTIPAHTPVFELVADSYSGTDAIEVNVSGKAVKLVSVGAAGTSGFSGIDVGNTYYTAAVGLNSSLGEPHADDSFSASGNKLWAPVSSGFRSVAAGAGWFSALSYEYVGEGKGEFEFTEGSDDLVLTTKIVLFEGGPTNNNWFYKYVMDYTNDEIQKAKNGVGDYSLPEIELNTVAAKNLTTNDVREADLIILGYGFNIDGDSYKEVYCADYKNDFTTTGPLGLVTTYATTEDMDSFTGKNLKKPVVVDFGLAYGSPSVSGSDSMSASTNTVVRDQAKKIIGQGSGDILRSAAKIRGYSLNASTKTRSFVADNIYVMDSYGYFELLDSGRASVLVFNAGNPIVSRKILVETDENVGTPMLNKVSFIGNELGASSLKTDVFFPVVENIIYENFLRKVRYGTAGKDGNLAVNCTTATTLRHIINAASARKIDNKTTVRLLDIEPRTGKIDDKDLSEISSSLGKNVNVQVTTMSVTEYNAIQADICEEFDMVYIGASVTGFKTDSKNSKNYITYNDTDMTYNPGNEKNGRIFNTKSDETGTMDSYIKRRNRAFWGSYTFSNTIFGLRYTNIGETLPSGTNYNLSGLLDRDYKEDHTASIFSRRYYHTVFNATAATTQFRASGNDLTETSAKKLEEFANLGYPVIFSNDLLKPPEYDDIAKRAVIVIKYRYILLNGEFIFVGGMPKLSCEGDTLSFYLDLLAGTAGNSAWRSSIRSARVKLFKVNKKDGDELLDTRILTRGEYSCSFNLSDFEDSEDSLILPGDQYYCTYEILSVAGWAETLKNVLGVVGNWTDFMPFVDLKVNIENGRTDTATIRGDAEPLTVDSSSELFKLIDGVAAEEDGEDQTSHGLLGKFNVMSCAALSSETSNYRSSLLPKLVNLSKPTVAYLDGDGDGVPAKDEYPTKYYKTDVNGMSALEPDTEGHYVLQYKFKIQNDADPSPATTRYKAFLYLDNNGNGKYEDGEKIEDLVIRKLTVYSGGTSAVGARVENGTLLGSYGSNAYSSRTQNYYYAYYTLPDDVQGLVPWKLAVTEVYNDLSGTLRNGGHDSTVDYTRVAGEAQHINILQIDSGVEAFDRHLDLTDNISRGRVYGQLLNDTDVTSDFIVTMTTVKAGFDSNDTTTVNTFTTGTGEGAGATQTVINKVEGGGYTKQVGANEAETYSSLYELFLSYDMIIIGFGDAYKELGLSGAIALADYIKANGTEDPVSHETLRTAVLMAHDSTSLYSYADYSMLTSDSSRLDESRVGGTMEGEYGVYGYYTNALIRDLIGMDRYGVTSLKKLDSSKTVGLTKYAGLKKEKNGDDYADAYDEDFLNYIRNASEIASGRTGFVSNPTDYTNSTTGSAYYRELLKKGYSVAWQPGTRKELGYADYTANNTTVAETQGLTTSVLFRFLHKSTSCSYDLGSDARTLTTTEHVTQINKGQITTYPYNINTPAFMAGDNGTSGTGALLNDQKVPKTHGQTYQLNLDYSYSGSGSTSDMIVWYCLTGNSAVYQEGDVINNYYVYTVDNVTYTGSGHTTDVFNTTSTAGGVGFEAMLFVNTMIAAFRADMSTSGVSFTDKTGTETGIEDFFVITDGDTILATDSADHPKDESRNIYFTANDSDEPFFSADFSFARKNLDEVKIYEADTDVEATNGALKSTYVYYVKFDDILKAIIAAREPKEDTSPVTLSEVRNGGLTLTVTNDKGSKHKTLTFRQYKLFDLS